MRNVNDVNDISLINTREGKKNKSIHINNFQKTRYIVDKKCPVCGLDFVNGKCPAEKEYNSINPQHFLIWEEDGIRYWTYSPFWRDFFKDKEKDKEFIPVKKSYTHSFKADKETLKEALRQEKERYDNGFIYKSEWVKIRGKVWKKGRWIKKEV